MNFSGIKEIVIPEGKAIQIKTNSSVIWSASKENEYTLLNYIIVPNLAWFNTGIVPSGDKWTYETEMYAESWGTNQYYYFAVRQTKYAVSLYCPIHVCKGYLIRIGRTNTSYVSGLQKKWVKIKSEIQDGLQNMWVDDVLKVTDTLPINYTYTYPLYLFAANYNGSMYQGTAGRIKYLKASKGNEVVRHFVAAKRNSDGVCGLLDLVENKFYTNAGSGTITGA